MGSFKIPSIPPTTQKAIRFPNNLIDDIEEILIGRDCSFSAFVIEATRVAVEEVKKQKCKR